MTSKFDIGIVGSGPAGYTAALHGSKRGKSAVLFEKAQIGGVCLNRGCIPTKAILYSAEVVETAKSAENLGINIENINVDFQKVIERKNLVVSRLRKGLELTLKNSGVKVINEEAKIIDKNTIEANGETYICGKIICATGSEPRSFKGMEFDHEQILNSDDVLNMNKLPKNIRFFR